MREKKSGEIGKPTMANVGIMEISSGILALFVLLGILTHSRLIEADPTSGWKLILAACACSLYFFLGIIVSFRTRIARALHFFFIPFISAVVIVTAILLPAHSLKHFLFVGTYLVVGAISMFYNILSRD